MSYETELKACQKLYKDLQKLEEKAKIKANKEKEKRTEAFIIFKDIECYTEEDLLEIWGVGDCTEKEYEKALKKLKEKLNVDDNKETPTDVYLRYIENYIISIANEINHIKFKMLPIEEQTKILEERNKTAGIDY